MGFAPFEYEALRLKSAREKARQDRIARNKPGWDRFLAGRELASLVHEIATSDKPVTAELRTQVEKLIATTQGGKA